MSQPHRPAPPPPPVRKGQVQAFEAMGSYKAKRDCELSFEEGDILFVLDRTDANWWQAKIDNKTGYIPSNYVSSDNVKNAHH
ncbi:osteoclast-stimulating factor 1-like [Macrobrachium nipponense]|uniref:osteoclast-stimulating factor 1-like n=1 Tax=Macrobrachium nipponense TaxID=159736 RepID=UPI0030C8AE5D